MGFESFKTKADRLQAHVDENVRTGIETEDDLMAYVANAIQFYDTTDEGIAVEIRENWPRITHTRDD